MEHPCLHNEIFRCVIGIASFIPSILTVIVTVGYWFKPCIRITINKVESSSSHQIRVKVLNNNLFRNKIKDIQCEMTFSEKEDFSAEVRTMVLIKHWIVCLDKKPANYVFIAELNNPKYERNYIDGMNFIRVRLLSPNFLGVKKVSEKIYEISDI